MTIVLSLLALQGLIGAFDTLYYHEWKARLPARGKVAAPELGLHAARDFFYAVLFGSLPWMQWRGAWAWVLVAVIVAEILLTLWDFVVEIAVRKELGDVYGGERVTHAIMGILYGATLAYLAPILWDWMGGSTALVVEAAPVSPWLRMVLTVMSVGVAISGLRDLYAALGLPHGGWPWTSSEGEVRDG